MSLFIKLFEAFPFFILFTTFFSIFILLLIVLYFYVNINLRGLCEIIFKDKIKYKRPLELFNFYFLSVIPINFWREFLNLRYDKVFKNLYDRDFYYDLRRDQIVELVSKYTYFFVIQYLAVFSGVISMFFLLIDFICNNFF